MKKTLRILTITAILAAVVLIAACKQFLADPEEFFSYWAAEVIGTDSVIDKPTQAIGGVLCVPSADDVTVTIKLKNPKNFRLVTPNTPSDAGRVITFPGLSPQPTYGGTNYTLVQTANDKLALTYKPAFLKAHEWSDGDISPEITLVSTDGRTFNKKFRLNLKVNTAPVLEYAGIGKTATADSSGNHFYVLLFRVKDMDSTITAGSIHKDIKKLIVTAGGVPSEIPLSLNTGDTDFPTGGDLLAAGAVQKLKPGDPELPSPTAQDWILRVKTDVKVGGPEKEYEVCIKDEQGLSSALIPARTQKNKLADVALLDSSTPITGTTADNPKECAGMSGKILTAQAAPAGTAITGTVSRFSSSPDNWTQTGTVSGTTTAAVNLPALDASETQVLYKISLKAQLSGYDDSDSKEFFIKLVRYEVPVLKLKQDFSSGDNNLHCISAGTKAYVITEDIIPDAGQYNNSSKALLIYTASSSNFKLELSASAGTAVKYKLDSGSEQSPSAPAEITLTGGTEHTLEVWAVRGGIPGPHTTVYIKGIATLNTYSELKNVVQNAPEKGTGPGQYDYSSNIDIKIGDNLTASSADTEIAVTGGKDLMLSGSPFGTVRTVDAGGLGRILKISDSDTELTLSNIKLTGGYAADGKGGAVCVETGCSLLLYGKTVITPSTGSDINTPGKNDVYLADGAKIKLDDALQSPEPIVARITPEHYNDGDEVLGGSSIGSGTPPNYTRFSVTQRDDGFLWTIQSDGTLKAIPTTINDSSGAWKKLKDAVRDLPEGSTITVNGTITATNDYGNDNRGVIDITKNITIQGQNGASSDMLNANRVSLSTNAHPVFRVSGGKTLTLKNLTLTGGKGISGTFGGAINVTGGGTTAELEGCTIEDCQAEKGGAIGCGKGSTVTLTNTTIKKCTAHTSGNTSSGGAIYAEGATVTMTGCTLTGNKADKQGGAICAEKTGAPSNTPSTVTIEGGTIGGTEAADANKATGAYTDGGGGGIYIGEACTLTMKAPAGSPAQGVQVIGNTAFYNGAGIYTKGNLTMEKCTITDNKTTGADNNTGGGGVYVESGIVEIKDATKIYHNCTDESGGGIYVNNGTVTLTNATIGGEQFYDGTDLGKTKGNKAQYCGGIHVKNGTITMENCTLSSNTARDAGGIQADNGNLTVKGCTLTNNKAAGFGGGIYVTGGTFTMENCTLTGNTTGDEGGGGVYVEGGTFKMKGSSRITPSTGGDANVAGKNDVYLKNDAKITVDSVLTGTAPVARITVPDNKYLPTTQVLTADSGVTLENETYKFAVTPQTSPTPQEWTVGGNGCLKEGRYTEVPYGQLETYLANASSTEVNYIEVTGISAADLTGSYGSPPDPGALGQKIKNNSAKKVALKLPSGLSVTDMSACFSQCENLVSLENFPSGVTDMRACFYGCENLTTVPAIPATVTSMMECFRYCRSLTTVPNIPSEVYDMTRCFQYCEKLQSIKMNCPYGVNFYGAFSGCDALPNGGIKVPSLYLAIYKNNAGTMGTTKEKFSAITP